MITEEEKRATVEAFIKDCFFRIGNLERLYGKEGSTRIWDARAEIKHAREFGYEYVVHPKAFWARRLEQRHVLVIPAASKVIQLLRSSERHMYELHPEEFELFVCDRLTHMGFEVERVGRTCARDGGVDIVACPRDLTEFPFLLAVQAKHHRSPSRKIGPAAVKQLQAVVADLPFHAGLLVTNTTFTPDAQWFAKHRAHIVRLRDIDDLRRWIWDNFLGDQEGREIPDTIEVRPGLMVRVPKDILTGQLTRR